MIKKQNKIGIIGGLGPESTARFYIDIIKYYKKLHPDYYPSIVIDSISFDKNLESEIIVENKNENKMLSILKDSAKKIKKSGADFCVMPCNTLHIFYKDINKILRMVSIIDSVASEIKYRKIKKVFLLATTKTIKSNIYTDAFDKSGIKYNIPSKTEQHDISSIILKILNNKYTKKDINYIGSLIKKYNKNGCEAIVLGCTDFDIIFDELNKFNIPIIDSLDVLAKMSSEEMFNVKR